MDKNRVAQVFFVLALIVCVGLAMGYHASAMEEEHHEPVAHETTGHKVAHEGHESHHYSKAQFLDLLWRAINFFLFAAIIYKFAAKPVRNALSQREEKISNTLGGLEKDKQLARQKFLEYEAKLAQLDKEKEKIIEEFIALGEVEKQKIIEQANKMAEQIKEGAKRAAAQEAKMSKDELKVEVADMATKMAKEIIKENFKPADQNKIVEEYLAKMGG
jgi:F-type H+-transporting ATPase subunit b